MKLLRIEHYAKNLKGVQPIKEKYNLKFNYKQII